MEKKLDQLTSAWIQCFPPAYLIYEAYKLTPFDEVKIVLLGQDPYHGKGQAHGLAFSVPDWVKFPPSLRNIFKEIQQDLWGETPSSGDLSYLAKQWVLLLNSVLTVEANQAASHKNLGRNQLTDATIKVLSDQWEGLVFLLRWKFAQSKKSLIDGTKHLILETSHPSPLWVWRWFDWCQHFSKTNRYLEDQWKNKIQRFANH